MCGQSTSTATTQTQYNVAPEIKQAAQKALSRADRINRTGFRGFTGDRVPDFNSTQNDAFSRMRAYVGGPHENMAGTGAGYVKNFAQAGPQSIDAYTLYDESSPLGAIQSYMNPYLEGVLNPVLKRINEQGAIARNEIGSGAHMAGAFGDARHGILEAQQMRDQSELASDVTGRIYADAFADAMGRRADDRSVLMEADSANANLVEQQLARLFQGGMALPQLEAAGDQNIMGRLQALLNVGDREFQREQGLADASYEEYLRAYEHPFRQLDALLGGLSGYPAAHNVTQTTTQKQPNNSGWGLVGGLLGGLF